MAWLRIFNLPENDSDTMEHDLLELFCTICNVKRVVIARDGTGACKKWGWIRVDDNDDKEAVMAKINRFSYLGHTILCTS